MWWARQQKGDPPHLAITSVFELRSQVVALCCSLRGFWGFSKEMAAGAELDSLPAAPMPADAEQPKPCGSTPGEPEKENMVFFLRITTHFLPQVACMHREVCSQEYILPIQVVQSWFLPQLKSQSPGLFYHFLSLRVSPSLSAVGCSRHSWPNQQEL